MSQKKELKVLKDSDFELLKGQKIDNYIQFLSHIGHTLKKEELENCRLDATGYSPDLAKRLGEDYTNKYIVITTINQRDDIILRDDFSFLMPLINFIYSKQEVFDLINDITLKEVLIGKINCYYDKRFRRFFIELDLETPGNSVKRMKEIKNEIATLKSDPYRMLSKARNQKLKKLISEPYDLSEKFPSLDIIKVPENNILPLRKQVECFRESNSQGDTYYFIGQRNVVIYFSNVKPSVYLGDDVDIFLNGSNRDQALNVLFRHGFISFKDDLTNPTLENMAWESLMNTISSSSFFSDLGGGVEISQNQLRARISDYQKVRNRITKDTNQNNILFRELDFSLKKDMVEAKQYRREVNEILAKLDPENFAKMYMYDMRKFKKHFSSAPDEEKISILAKVTAYIDRTQKHNMMLNTWLAEYYFKICKESGIRFIV